VDTTPERVVAALLERHGRTYADEAGIDVVRNSPKELFRLLCLALLLSARIRASVGMAASQALTRKRWTSPKAMAAAPWSERARVLNHAGYARYDERTATMLGDPSELLIERWGGDLRRLREEAGRRTGLERRLLKEFKGIGDVGVDIFFREVQEVWDELRSFVDRRALQAAARLRLGESPGDVAELVPDDRLPAFSAALVRVELADGHDAVLQEAEGS
jgi:hypothetical protein